LTKGLALYNTTDLNALGKLARHGSPTGKARADDVLQRQPAFQPHEHLRRRLQVLRLLQACASGRCVHALHRKKAFQIARDAVAEGATEAAFVGGLNSKLPSSTTPICSRPLKREFPSCISKRLTMVELDFFARFYKMSDEDVIEKLHAAGMDSCPGGGAEIFAEPTRSRICDHKCDGPRWLELAGKVHKAGLKTNATMLYGHIETTEDR
jgi:aminodeoxyfutalosine synthase